MLPAMPRLFLHRLTATERTKRNNHYLGAYLAFVAGAINAGGFMAINRYTSHMTGIISSLGDSLAVGEYTAVFGGIFLLLTFIAGAASTGILINWGLRKRLASAYSLPLVLEAFDLLLFGGVGANIASYSAYTVPMVAVLLCYLMGVQNAAITKISSAEIRTTHMTGIVTDIGIELGRLLYWNQDREANQRHFVQANRQRLKTHSIILSMFLSGGIVGALSFKYLGYISVVPLALSLLMVSAPPLLKDLHEQFIRPKPSA